MGTACELCELTLGPHLKHLCLKKKKKNAENISNLVKHYSSLLEQLVLIHVT